MQNRVTQLLRQRHFWVLMLVMAVVVSACAPTAPAASDGAPAPAAEAAATEPAPEPTPLPEIPAPREGVFTYWGGLIFSDAANQMLVDAITAWGKSVGSRPKWS